MTHRSIDTIGIAYPLLREEHLARIRAAAPDARVVRIDAEEERAEVAPHLEVVLGRLPVEQLGTLPSLRWLQQTGAGADWLIHAPEVAASDLVVTSASGVHAVPIAEHVLALMFTLSRRIHRFVKAQMDHEWFRRGRLGEIEGTTLGVVGLGAIGSKLAEKAKGLGMRVLGLRRDPARGSACVDEMFGPDALHALLEQSDWVAICAALTPETAGLIGERELSAMKSTAYLINIGRGGLVDEKMLVRALLEGWIAGAGLDVFEREPLPADSPLWDMRNVVITPHFAGATPVYADRVTDIFTENLRRYQRGEPLVNVVDKRLAY